MKPRYYIAIATYCAAIFWLSSQSSPVPMPMRFPGEDKIAHMVLYGGLAALIAIGLHRAPRSYPAWIMRFGPVLFAACYGLSDEIHQAFVPFRTASALDLVADIAGAALANAACARYFRWRPVRTNACTDET